MTEGVYTRKVAAQVGSTIKYMIEHPDDERFFELELVADQHDSSKDWTEWIRLDDSAGDHILTLADESEVVRCVTRNGRRIDIIFAHVDEREIQPALVLLGVEA